MKIQHPHLQAHNKKKSAYSLVEILVTMAIFGVLSVMLMQSLLNNLFLSARISARSQMRSEIDRVMSLVERDLRNADQVSATSCKTGTTNLPTLGVTCAAHCQFNIGQVKRTWCFVTPQPTEKIGQIVRFDDSEQTFATSTLLDIQKFAFDLNVNADAVNGSTPYANILVTIEAQNEGLSITNQVKQLSVTTRNYRIK